MLSKLTFILALAASVSAQTYTIADIPNCALQPALTAIGTTGCATTDLACVCKQTSFLTDLSTAIQKVCSADDYNKAVTVAQSLCLQNGVTLSVPGGTAATSAASAAASGSASGSAAASGSAVASGSASVSATGSAAAATGSSSRASAASAASTASAAATSAVASVASGSTATTSKPASATSNGAAAKGTWAAAGLLGVGALLAAL